MATTGPRRWSGAGRVTPWREQGAAGSARTGPMAGWGVGRGGGIRPHLARSGMGSKGRRDGAQAACGEEGAVGRRKRRLHLPLQLLERLKKILF